jgi:hypothetical protein
MTLALGPNIIKLFTFEIYNILAELNCWCLEKLRENSSMFIGEAWSLPKSGVPERGFTRIGSGITHNTGLGWKGL